MTIDELIMEARSKDASDVHISHDQPVAFRCLGALTPVRTLDEGTAEPLIRSMMTNEQQQLLLDGRDADFCYVTPDGMRQRVNVFLQQGHMCAAIRLLRDDIPTIEDLQLPGVVRQLASLPRGLVLVTGPTGSGKSTTLAAMVQFINTTRRAHIITIEDPVEYKYTPQNCIIHQREVGTDTESFAGALRSALREDPDVILVGEMRDYETISAALTAAETGHLVFSTLHTIGAAKTVDRIVNACPGEIQQEIRTQLAGVLGGCITQELIPRADGSGRIAAQEVLVSNDAVRSLIREDKVHQIASIMQTGMKDGMWTLNYHLAQLVQKGQIDYTEAMDRASDPDEFNNYMGM